MFTIGQLKIELSCGQKALCLKIELNGSRGLICDPKEFNLPFKILEADVLSHHFLRMFPENGRFCSQLCLQALASVNAIFAS